jgi:hypothetical protein
VWLKGWSTCLASSKLLPKIIIIIGSLFIYIFFTCARTGDYPWGWKCCGTEVPLAMLKRAL